LVSSTISVVTTKDLRRAGFPFRSGSLCLDFVATVAKRGMGDRELLEGPAELAIWLHVAGLPEVDGPVSEADMTGVWELRETLHGMTRARVAGKRLSRLAVAMVNAAALAGPPPSLLAPDGESVRPPAAAPLASVISIVARDAVELFGGQLDPAVHDRVQVRVTAWIEGRAAEAVRRDAEFFINTAGVLGEQYLEIVPGKDWDHPPIQAGTIVHDPHFVHDPPRTAVPLVKKRKVCTYSSSRTRAFQLVSAVGLVVETSQIVSR